MSPSIHSPIPSSTHLPIHLFSVPHTDRFTLLFIHPFHPSIPQSSVYFGIHHFPIHPPTFPSFLQGSKWACHGSFLWPPSQVECDILETPDHLSLTWQKAHCAASSLSFTGVCAFLEWQHHSICSESQGHLPHQPEVPGEHSKCRLSGDIYSIMS